MKIRILPLETMLNTRDLGGYSVGSVGPTASGGRKKQVKWGLLYRSGELYGNTEGDKRLLEKLGIRTVVDVRSGEEKKAAPEILPTTVRQLVELPIDAGNLMGTIFSADGGWTYASTADGARAEMKKLYTALPEEAIPKYRVLFSLLADPENVPLLFHCTAGKDRTGLAAALLLHALGAEMETIFEDYLLSTACLGRRYQSNAENAHLIPYWSVEESYLKTALIKLESYGGIDRYIRGELGAEIGHLRNLYTE
jgi:protein-tyrosine phosphatase